MSRFIYSLLSLQVISPLALRFDVFILCSSMYFLVPRIGYTQDLSQLKSGIPPAQNRWIPYQQGPTEPQVHKQNQSLTVDDLQRPERLLAALKRNPDGLNVERMTPDIASEVSRVLLIGGELTQSLKILKDARLKWPNHEGLLQAWVRIMVNMGTTSYALPPLEKALQRNPAASYSRYLYALCLFLESPEDVSRIQKSIQNLEQLLQNDPNYVGPDGISSTQVRQFADHLKSKLNR